MKNKNVKYVFLIKMSRQTSLSGSVIALIFLLVVCTLVFCICIISGIIENLFNDYNIRNDNIRNDNIRNDNIRNDNMENDKEIINNEVRRSDKNIPLYKLDDSIVEI